MGRNAMTTLASHEATFAPTRARVVDTARPSWLEISVLLSDVAWNETHLAICVTFRYRTVVALTLGRILQT